MQMSAHLCRLNALCAPYAHPEGPDLIFVGIEIDSVIHQHTSALKNTRGKN